MDKPNAYGRCVILSSVMLLDAGGMATSTLQQSTNSGHQRSDHQQHSSGHRTDRHRSSSLMLSDVDIESTARNDNNDNDDNDNVNAVAPPQRDQPMVSCTQSFHHHNHLPKKLPMTKSRTTLWRKNYYPAKEVMFLPEFVCLSVCLCVSKITLKVMEGSEILRECREWQKLQVFQFWSDTKGILDSGPL